MSEGLPARDMYALALHSWPAHTLALLPTDDPHEVVRHVVGALTGPDRGDALMQWSDPDPPEEHGDDLNELPALARFLVEALRPDLFLTDEEIVAQMEQLVADGKAVEVEPDPQTGERQWRMVKDETKEDDDE